MNAEALVKVKGGDVIQPMKFHPLSLKTMVLEMPQNQDYVEKENKIQSTKCSATSSPGEKIKEKFLVFVELPQLELRLRTWGWEKVSLMRENRWMQK